MENLYETIVQGIEIGMHSVAIMTILVISLLMIGHVLLVKSTDTIFENRRKSRQYPPAA